VKNFRDNSEQAISLLPLKLQEPTIKRDSLMLRGTLDLATSTIIPALQKVSAITSIFLSARPFFDT
jgi:hypothetical protein